MVLVSGLPKLAGMRNTSVRMSLKQFYCVWSRLILGECIPHKGPSKARNLPRRFTDFSRCQIDRVCRPLSNLIVYGGYQNRESVTSLRPFTTRPKQPKSYKTKNLKIKGKQIKVVIVENFQIGLIDFVIRFNFSACV